MANRPEANRGIQWPRLYDLLLFVLSRGRDRAYRDEILGLTGLGPGTRVLDVGCGTGTQAILAFSRCQPGGRVIGVDISSNMLAVARRKARRAGADISFHQSDAAALPFPDAEFDVVTITTVMHMIPEARRELSITEAARVLMPGGRLVLIDYAGDPDSRTHMSAKHGPHRVFDLHTLRDPLAQAGLQKIDGGSLGWLGLHFLRGTKE